MQGPAAKELTRRRPSPVERQCCIQAIARIPVFYSVMQIHELGEGEFT